MKMVKSLLLGSAAGLVAVAGAQAADLPVKAAPVQYVKICTLYGVGFYYIPGTDMCIKIGGWVRAEYGWGQNGNFAWGWANTNINDRTTNNSDFRARGYITADARNQTEYGTVRGYIAVGVSENEHGGDVGAATAFSANRAFIQWAGFTFGRAQSFFDFYSAPATAYWGAYPSSDTGDGGHFVMAYTAQFGNGFSATIAAEQPRKTNLIVEGDFTPGVTGGIFSPYTPFVAGGFVANGYGGFQAPDVVANLRIDQPWGSAQIMGALHQINMQYYGIGVQPGPDLVGKQTGHADDELGWVIGAGLKWNAPMIGTGDYFQMQVNYTQGALRYIFQTPNSNWGIVNGSSLTYGILSDAVNAGNTLDPLGETGWELTTAWNINAAYEHFWSPRWRTSIYGGYAEVKYGNTANNILCTVIGGANWTQAAGQRPVAAAGCDQNWNTWWVGTRTQWNVTKDFYMGVDVLYSKLQGASVVDGLAIGTGLGNTAQNTVTPFVDHETDNLAIRFRVHRDFYP